MQIIRKNFGLKVLAVTLAVIGWAYVRFAGPLVAAHFKGLIVQVTPVPCASGAPPSPQPRE